MLEPGELFDYRYRIEKKLGSGGMGEVYLATQLDANRQVALKLAFASSIDKETVEQRFLREFQTLSKLKHPHIITFYGFALTDRKLPYAICEYVQGKTLRAIIDEGSLDWKRILGIAVQICQALNVVHNENMVHRDLKPENIMFDELLGTDYAKLLDFGLVELSSEDEIERLTKSGQLVGTASYLSPEQCLSQTLDGRSDIYALGCIIFEAIAGEKLFVENNPSAIVYAHLHKDPKQRLETIADRIPLKLKTLLLRMLSKFPQDRPTNTLLLAREFEEILANEKFESGSFQSKRARIGGSILVTSILILLSITVAFVQSRKETPHTSKPKIDATKSLVHLHSANALMNQIKRSDGKSTIKVLRSWLSHNENSSKVSALDKATIFHNLAATEAYPDPKSSGEHFLKALKILENEVSSKRASPTLELDTLKSLACCGERLEDRKSYAIDCIEILTKNWTQHQLNNQFVPILNVLNGLGITNCNEIVSIISESKLDSNPKYAVVIGDHFLLSKHPDLAIQKYSSAIEVLLKQDKQSPVAIGEIVKHGMKSSIFGKTDFNSGPEFNYNFQQLPFIIRRMASLAKPGCRALIQQALDTSLRMHEEGAKFSYYFWLDLANQAYDYQLSGPSNAAVKLALSLATNQIQNFQCRIFSAKNLIELGKSNEALQLYAEVSEQGDQATRLKYAADLSSCLWKKGQHSEAEKLWDKSRGRIEKLEVGERIECYSSWAKSLATTGKVNEAKQLWDSSTALCQGPEAVLAAKAIATKEAKEVELTGSDWVERRSDKIICEWVGDNLVSMAFAGMGDLALGQLDAFRKVLSEESLMRLKGYVLEECAKYEIKTGDKVAAREHLIEASKIWQNWGTFPIHQGLQISDLVRCNLLMAELDADKVADSDIKTTRR